MILKTLAELDIGWWRSCPAEAINKFVDTVYDRREPLRVKPVNQWTCRLGAGVLHSTGSSNAAFAFFEETISTNVFKRICMLLVWPTVLSLAMRTDSLLNDLTHHWGAHNYKTIGKQLQIEKDLCHNFLAVGFSVMSVGILLQWRSWKTWFGNHCVIQKAIWLWMIMFIKPSKIPTRKIWSLGSGDIEDFPKHPMQWTALHHLDSTAWKDSSVFARRYGVWWFALSKHAWNTG